VEFLLTNPCLMVQLAGKAGLIFVKSEEQRWAVRHAVINALSSPAFVDRYQPFIGHRGALCRLC
jgi:hypothetical protein